VLEALVSHFGEEFQEEIDDSLSLTQGRYSDWGDAGTFTADGTEYNIIESEDEAEGIALELVKQDLEDEPSIFTQSWLQGFMKISNTDRRIIANEEADMRTEDMTDEEIVDFAGLDDEMSELEDRKAELEDTISELEDADDKTAYQDEIDVIEDEISDLIDKAKEEAHDKVYEEWYKGLADPVDFLVEEQGIYSIEDLMKQSFIMIDIDEAAQDTIDTDGWAHFLSRYDGNYENITGGFVIFRES